MIDFKSCQRCLGDRILDWDGYGWYWDCLTCGYVTYPDDGPGSHVHLPATSTPHQRSDGLAPPDIDYSDGLALT
jgi:hypothetical protein